MFVVLSMLHILHSEVQPLIEDLVRVPVKVLSSNAVGTCPSNQHTSSAKMNSGGIFQSSY